MTFYVKCHYNTCQGSDHDEGDGSDYGGFSLPCHNGSIPLDRFGVQIPLILTGGKYGT